MGTSFSAVYAVIFMILLETTIVEDPRFRQFIKLYKRFIDDIFLIWTGSAAALQQPYAPSYVPLHQQMKQSSWTGADMKGKQMHWILQQNAMIKRNF